MGSLMRSFRWEQTAIGTPDTWPKSLTTAVRIILTSQQPMFVWWGDHLVNLYNDSIELSWAESTLRRWADPHRRFGRKSGIRLGRAPRLQSQGTRAPMTRRSF